LKPKPTKGGDPFLVAFGIYGGVGLQLAAAVVGGLLLGHYLDGRFQTHPWLAMTGLLLGSVGGFYNLIKILIWNQQRKQSQDSS
jgi:ATP synthase protein I